ncbi:uncharacterized protein LY79DRAFT_543911 [Colletotrichum navitas]|uniref:Uncharacterized protein n=1 Tax=Colletotrichum navitas TaxID=681940 RepID=A0AAD8V722_9PEZI|nr:uncharacterized protein LY79DRAFT_543911 [Colletotrichum navitas]KAK1596687.1 hypothetical protein LY79DRAFT_543911 [Colletotrichum navitas]
MRQRDVRCKFLPTPRVCRGTPYPYMAPPTNLLFHPVASSSFVLLCLFDCLA